MVLVMAIEGLRRYHQGVIIKALSSRRYHQGVIITITITITITIIIITIIIITTIFLLLLMVLVLILILLRQCRYSEFNTITWDSPNAICTIPRITIFPGGIPTIPSHGRFMAAISLTSVRNKPVCAPWRPG